MARASWLIVLYHLAFAALAAVILRWLQVPQLGQAIAAGTLLYVLLLPAMAWLLGQHELLDAWSFLLPLSLCQVLPDWILVQQLGVLAFPDLGAPRIGPVPAYMLGLWVAPLLLVLWLSDLTHRISAGLALLVALAVSLAVFAAAEWAAQPLALWAARGVEMHHGVAIYVLPAEMLLGLVAWVAYQEVQGRSWFVKIAGAAGVSVFYTGALVTSYFLIERVL